MYIYREKWMVMFWYGRMETNLNTQGNKIPKQTELSVLCTEQNRWKKFVSLQAKPHFIEIPIRLCYEAGAIKKEAASKQNNFLYFNLPVTFSCGKKKKLHVQHWNYATIMFCVLYLYIFLFSVFLFLSPTVLVSAVNLVLVF